MKQPRSTPSFIVRRHFLAPMASYDDVMSLSVRRGFLWPAVDLYGGFAGFYDYGHNGVLMRRRWEDLWAETFLGLSDNYYLIDTTTILPEAPLKASGHVDHFSDLLVTCTRCGESYRGDQLLEAATHEEHEGLTPAELDARIRELKIRCPNCKGELGPARPFNMMFPLEVCLHPYPDRMGRGEEPARRTRHSPEGSGRARSAALVRLPPGGGPAILSRSAPGAARCISLCGAR